MGDAINDLIYQCTDAVEFHISQARAASESNDLNGYYFHYGHANAYLDMIRALMHCLP